MKIAKNLLKNTLVCHALLNLLKAKGRKNEKVMQSIAKARITLNDEDVKAFDALILQIHVSYQYANIRLKAIHNQRNSAEDRRLARVWSFMENNPDHPVLKGEKF